MLKFMHMIAWLFGYTFGVDDSNPRFLIVYLTRKTAQGELKPI